MKFIVPLVLLAACASAPGGRQQQLDVEAPAAWTAGAVAGAVDSLWWMGMGDERLTELVGEALAHNYNLQAAAARLQAAGAQAKIAGVDRLPQLGAGGSGLRRKQNFIGLPIPGGEQQVLSSTTNNFGVNLNASWEIDLWGRLRAGQRAALADWQAAAADLRGAHLSLVAQTARLYLAAVEAQRQVELAAATVENYRLSTTQIESRYQRGLRPSLDVRLGRTSQAAAEAVLYQRQRQLDGVLRQLEILLGRYPAGDAELADALPEVPPPVPAGLPAELVARRPDLVAAERRLAAADARLVAARKTLYPRISLTASGGRSSSELGDLLDGDFSVWSLVGNISQPLFQGGRLRGGVDLARAGTEQALAQYADRVLRAYAEVESALAAAEWLARQEEAVTTAAREAGAARRLVEERYGKGLADLITLLEAQRRAFDAESQLLAVRRQRLQARLDLHLALGGGWPDETITEVSRAE